MKQPHRILFVDAILLFALAIILSGCQSIQEPKEQKASPPPLVEEDIIPATVNAVEEDIITYEHRQINFSNFVQPPEVPEVNPPENDPLTQPINASDQQLSDIEHIDADAIFLDDSCYLIKDDPHSVDFFIYYLPNSHGLSKFERNGIEKAAQSGADILTILVYPINNQPITTAVTEETEVRIKASIASARTNPLVQKRINNIIKIIDNAGVEHEVMFVSEKRLIELAKLGFTTRWFQKGRILITTNPTNYL